VSWSRLRRKNRERERKCTANVEGGPAGFGFVAADRGRVGAGAFGELLRMGASCARFAACTGGEERPVPVTGGAAAVRSGRDGGC
jgi:hypothetical protein